MIASRSVDLQFRLGTGEFGVDGSNTVDVKGHRCSANIVKTGGVSMSQLDLRVWGLPLDVMNKLTILNKLRYADARFNTVTVKVGQAVAFTGIISECWADMSGQPDSTLVCSAHTGLMEKIKPIKPVSYRGDVDVATLLAGIAAQMDPPRTLENSGVTATLRDPYLPGTALDQIYAVAKAANVTAILDDNMPDGQGGAVLAIWPAGAKRGEFIAEVSAATGMVGYPVFTQNGIQIISLYNPSLVFGVTVDVKSDLTPANGKWIIASVAHNLDGDMPGGQWFTRIECGLLGQATPIVAP